MSTVSRVKEYLKKVPSRINQENFAIIHVTVCDRCGIQKPLGDATLETLEKITWVHYGLQKIDICPACLTNRELEAANKHIQAEINKITDMEKRIRLKINFLNRELENCNHSKQTIICFQNDFNEKKAA